MAFNGVVEFYFILFFQTRNFSFFLASFLTNLTKQFENLGNKRSLKPFHKTKKKKFYNIAFEN